MKRLLTYLGALFLVLIMAAGVFVGVAAYNGSKLDKESKAEVDRIVPKVIGEWSVPALLSDASPQLFEASPEPKLRELFQLFNSALGPLTKYKGAKGESHVFVGVGNQPSSTTADYVVDADFQKASAKILLRLVKNGPQWQILGFNVNSDALLKGMTPSPVTSESVRP